jgi:hypothetical protein
MRFVFDDGGRAATGFRGRTGDCTCRAIAIAAEMPYQTVYDLLNERSAMQRITKRQPRRGSARTGMSRAIKLPRPLRRNKRAEWGVCLIRPRGVSCATGVVARSAAAYALISKRSMGAAISQESP